MFLNSKLKIVYFLFNFYLIILNVCNLSYVFEKLGIIKLVLYFDFEYCDWCY